MIACYLLSSAMLAAIIWPIESRDVLSCYISNGVFYHTLAQRSRVMLIPKT